MLFLLFNICDVLQNLPKDVQHSQPTPFSEKETIIAIQVLNSLKGVLKVFGIL